MQSAGVRVKALKLELGKDLKLQASGIWMQLWDQNCDTCNTLLPTLGMERITKAQIVNYKHHQIKRFLQDQVLISFFFFLWKAPIDFIQNFLQDKSERFTPVAFMEVIIRFYYKSCFSHLQIWACEINFLKRELSRKTCFECQGMCLVQPIQYTLQHWADLRGVSQHVVPHSLCHV